MELKRRDFIKLTSAAAIGAGLSQLGFELGPVKAYAEGLKTDGAKEVITICPFCSVSCHIIAYVKDGKLVSTEGDPDYPINQGALCAKGAAMLSMTNGDERLKKPLYRAPNSTKWEEKSWEWTITEIAKRVKATRDKDLILKNEKGETVNRLESMFMLGTSHASNEECSIIHQAARSLGVVHIDHQART
jgi:formate dehydrogenase major subunit